MNKKFLAFILCLAACGLGSPAASGSSALGGSPLPSAEAPAAALTESAANSSVMLSACQSALDSLVQNYIMPAGGETGCGSNRDFGSMEENVFVIAGIVGGRGKTYYLRSTAGNIAACTR